MSRRRQHTLPASYIGGFAEDWRPHARERVLWVGRRGSRGIYLQKAENLSYTKDIYTLTRRIWASRQPWNRYELDAIWAHVERRLSVSVDRLIQSSTDFFDAKPWLTVLVEFVAQIFVRGTDFGERFVGRIKAISPDIVELFKSDTSDQINGVRLLELHRIRGAVLRGDWTILHSTSSRFITNDIARTPVISEERRGYGYLVPLRADAALLLMFPPSSPALHLRPAPDADEWVVGPIRHESIDGSQVARFNELLAYSARSEIYGGRSDIVRDLHVAMRPTPVPLVQAEPTFLAEYRDLGDTRQHEQLWLLVHTPPSQCAFG
jgi:Protein of unknown function (DUF4238)